MLTNVDPSASSRLPQRTSNVPKNRTGVFVEMKNGPPKVPHRSIPPLARQRRFPVSSNSNRYSNCSGQMSMTQESNSDKLLILSSATLVSLYCKLPPRPPICLPLYPTLFLRVPNVYPKQIRVIQNIRAKQEWNGGFFPKPVKKSRSKQFNVRIDHRPSPHLLQGLPDYRDLTRRSARNFVAASNNGVTHLEDLRSESITSFSVKSTTETNYDDINSVAGLEDVYKTIIKEEALTELLKKERRVRSNLEKKQSPLLIRSFRNPQNPHPVIQYSDLRELSNSSKNHHFISRPPVPAPYFYNGRTLPRAADNGGSKVHLSRLSGARSSDHILAAPGAGKLSMSVLGFQREQNPPPGIEGQPPPALLSRGKLTESDERIGMMERFRVPSTTPATSVPDLQTALEDGGTASINNPPVVIPDLHDEPDDLSIVNSTECIDRGESELSFGITLSLETDEGISKIIDLEEEEERNKRDVIEYHTAQRALQGITGEQTVDECKEESSDEQNQLLHEDSEIVDQIHHLQKLTCSDDEVSD